MVTSTQSALWAPDAPPDDGMFSAGEIVEVEGRPGEWELMKPGPGPGVWTVEPAQLEDRVSTKVAVSTLQRLADAPHVRRGDLVMQRYPEQERAAVVGAVVRLGQWVAVKSYTLPDGGVCRALDSVDRLEVVTAEQLAAAVRLDVVHGAHVGRIVQAVVSARAGQFRVVCRCAPGAGEICRDGRKVTWCLSLDSAHQLWDWHVSGPAPTGSAA
ncbi:hypothetical protein ADK61_22185 [Streptomyces sp. XY66]|uniref:hypothetical protein n=1 Tax=Streptomyces sp. XY66 TaxID=1415563 RepID=UPI0006C07309|nr:hypothetical protein [Streptomyces sp. XY66]KOU73707.1 hypothetical protein ADK61_22185 [Streptomyces sp. XY66]